MDSGVTRPGPTRAWARVSADLLAVAVWILQIAITSVNSHVMKLYLIRHQTQYWLDDFIHEKKDREILTETSYIDSIWVTVEADEATTPLYK